MTNATKQAALYRPFVVGSRDTQRVGYTKSVTLSTSSQRITPFNIDPIGYIESLTIYAKITGSNAGGAAVALQEDAPFSLFDAITLYDSGSKPIGGTMSGYEWHVFAKHGGFTGSDDARAHTLATWTALTTGAGATAGTGNFALRIPVALNSRNALGALLNKNAGSTLRLEMSLAPLASIYSTAPSAGASVEITIVVEGWLDAAPADTRGNPVRQDPPGGDTTMFISKHQYNVPAGAYKQRFDPIDGPVRALYHIFRTTAAGTRAAGEAAWPALSTLRYENLDPWLWPDWYWREKITRWFDYTGTLDTARGREAGVYPFIFFDDFGLKAGRENGFKYLPTSSQVNMSIDGTWGGAGTLDVLVNKIYPGGGDPLVLTGGR
jgi:hypothetical protein